MGTTFFFSDEKFRIPRRDYFVSVNRFNDDSQKKGFLYMVDFKSINYAYLYYSTLSKICQNAQLCLNM